MTKFYPNDLDIYGFCPKETEPEYGDWVTDRLTGLHGKVTYLAGVVGVYIGGVFYPIVNQENIRREVKT